MTDVPALLSKAPFDKIIETTKVYGVEPEPADVTYLFTPDSCVVETRIRAGFVAVKHQHDYDHASVLVKGYVRLITGKGTTLHQAPAALIIKAGLDHAVHALEDSVWLCIHDDPTKTDAVVVVSKEGA